MVASDHSPYGYSEKESNNIFECGSGTPGIETMLPVLLDAVNKNKTTLNRVVEATAIIPAHRFELSTKGKIAVNQDADLVLVDMNQEYMIRNRDMYTTPHVTIFDGRTIQGKIEKTIVRGHIVYDKGEFHQDPGYGIYTGCVSN
jgi:dihydroorotase-like cyclic amidohydrolase